MEYVYGEIAFTWELLEDAGGCVEYVRGKMLYDFTKKGSTIVSWYVTLLPGDYEKQLYRLRAFSVVKDRLLVTIPEGEDVAATLQLLQKINSHLSLDLVNIKSGVLNDDFVSNRMTFEIKFTLL